MAALSEDWRSSVSGQPWRVILVLGSLSLLQKSTLCFQTEDRVRIFPRSGNAPWQQCPKTGELPFFRFRANRDFRGRRAGIGRAV
jgi:hypothetical protein